MKRRDFVKTLSATGVALYASDLVGDLIAQTPKAKVLESTLQGALGHRAGRGQAPRLHVRRHPLHAQHQRQRRRPRPHRHRLVRLRRGRPRGERGLRRPRDPQRRVGLRQQPVRHRGRRSRRVTAQRHGSGQGQRREQAVRGEARAGAGVHGLLGGARQAEAGRSVARRQDRVPHEDQRGGAEGAGHHPRAVVDGVRLRVEVPGHVRRLLHRAGDLPHGAGLHRDRPEERQGQAAHVLGGAEDGGLRSGARLEDAGERRADLRRGGGALHGAARGRGPEGPGDDARARDAHHPRDRRASHRARSRRRLRGQLRRHQLREAGRHRQAHHGLEAVQRDLRPDARGRHVHRGLRR